MRNGLIKALAAGAIASQAAAAPVTISAGGHLITEVGINGSTARFIIDSAASAAVVMPALRERLALPRHDMSGMAGHGAIHGASGSAAVQLYRIDTLEIDGRSRTNLFAAGLEPLHGNPDVEGIVGADTLSLWVAEFDLPRGQFHLRDAATDMAASGAWRTIPFELNQARFPVLQGTIDGQPVTILLDTGARRTLLNWAAANALGVQAGDAGLTSARPVQGATAHQTMAVQRDFAAIQIGDLTLPGNALTVADLPVFRQLGFEGPAMILGMDKLREFRFVIDYQRTRLLVARPEAHTAP